MFEPYVGDRYGDPGNLLAGARVLILGESHYGDGQVPVGAADPGFTKAVVARWALQGPSAFFTHLAQLVAGRPVAEMGPAGKRAAWEAVAFANYVPMIVAPRPRMRPDATMFAAGAAAFPDLLRATEPQAIVVCGFGLWHHLFSGLDPARRADDGGQPIRLVSGIPAMRMRHPSAGYGWRTWRPLFEDLLARAS